MWTIRLVAIASLASATGAPLASVDSARGQLLFQSEGCVQCHSIDGKGGKIGPDLGKRIDRNYTPALLASVMWNHAPVMWAAIRERAVQTTPLSERDAADLFAYFYAARF